MKKWQPSIPPRSQRRTGWKSNSMDRLPAASSEAMRKGLEASLGSIQAKSFLYTDYTPSYPRSFSGQTLEFKYSTGVKQANVESDNDGTVIHDKLTVLSESQGRALQQDNYYLWPNLSPNYFVPANPSQYFPTQWMPQIPLQMAPQSNSSNYVFQDFHYFVVIDFEATCDKEKNPHPQEIIEFPSVLVNSRTGQVEDCFQMYVRPTYNKQLTEFCKELTGIQQSQVDKGILLSDVLMMHDKWLEDKGIKHTNFAVVTWSNWDCRVMLESECRYKRIRKPSYFNRWINLKIPFNKIFGDGRRKLKDAVELAGLTWEGRAHCGLDDAKNTARLVAHLMHLGFKLSITSSLSWQTADHPVAVQPQPQQQLQQQQPLQQIPVPENSVTCQPLSWNLHHHFVNIMPFSPLQAANHMEEPHAVQCFCGAISMKQRIQKSGPLRGYYYFGCGNWNTQRRGPGCSFFQWASASAT